MKRVSQVITGYSVRCREDPACRMGTPIHLTHEEYDYQMDRPDATWQCPICGGHADWDDDIYEEFFYGSDRVDTV